MNEKLIAFIICVNNEVVFGECQYYINRLHVPEGYAVEMLAISDADSMCAAYDLGMQSSQAKYKIYMHQDVFIRNINFLEDILRIFLQDESIGMIGMIGGNGMPKTGVAYRAWNVGNIDSRDPDMAYYLVEHSNQERDMPVEAVDGLLIATQYDLPWREDLFHNFDFYDVSQSFEMRRAGYKIVVPCRKVPWVIHDSSFAKLNHYDANRRIALKEYAEYFYAEDGFEFLYNEEWNRLSDELSEQIKQLMEAGEWEKAGAIIQSYRAGKMKSSILEMLGIMSDIYEKEKENGAAKGFFEDTKSWQDMYEKYMKTRFLLRRMELGMPAQEYSELESGIKENRISCDALIILIMHSVADRKVCLQKLIAYYRQSGHMQDVHYTEQVYELIKDKGIPLVYHRKQTGGSYGSGERK